MDNEDPWLPQKIDPILGKIPAAEAATFNCLLTPDHTLI